MFGKNATVTKEHKMELRKPWVLIVYGIDKMTVEETIGPFWTRNDAVEWKVNNRPDHVYDVAKLEMPK
jgi:hypothetical protein